MVGYCFDSRLVGVAGEEEAGCLAARALLAATTTATLLKEATTHGHLRLALSSL